MADQVAKFIQSKNTVSSFNRYDNDKESDRMAEPNRGVYYYDA